MLTGPTAAIVTATVAVSFGSYASAMFAGQSADRAKVFAALIVVAMTVVNIVGSELGAKAQTVIVYVVLGILALFAVVTILNMTPSLLAPSGYPPLREIMSSVALTFFAFLGSWGGDLHRQGPGPAVPPAAQGHVPGARDRHGDLCRHRPGVFGTLTVDKVISSGGTALAVAAEPSLGRAGYWLMSVTALFATAGATNSGLYPAAGLCERLAATGQFPPLLGRRLGDRVPMGLLVMAAASVVLALGFDLTAIASIGSAVALLVFMLVTAAHFRVRSQTGARLGLLVAAIATTAVAFLTFVFTTLVSEPASAVTLVVILLVAVVLDHRWRKVRDHRRALASGAAADRQAIGALAGRRCR